MRTLNTRQRQAIEIVKPEDDVALRPIGFDDYIGQRAIIDNLSTSVRATRLGGWQLDHYLFAGPPGLGKTSLAYVIAHELGAKLHLASAPTIEHAGELAGLLTGLAEGDVLFIDEIHRLAMPLQEMLYSAMEDRRVDLFAGKKAISMPLAKFTLLGATTHAGMLSAPLLDRFGFVWQLTYYEPSELTTIVQRSAGKLGIAIDELGAAEIARRSRGTPRIANRLLRRVRDHAIVAAHNGALVLGQLRAGGAVCSVTVNRAIAVGALEALSVDALGLDALDRAYLELLASRSAPIGIAAVAHALSQQRATIEDVVEPYLVQLGLVERTSRGRLATDAGRRHLEA
jgi:Holliday junction DNA helicase RuvB